MAKRTLTPQRDAFSDLPTDYEGLCRVLLPRPINDAVTFQNTVEVADALAGHPTNRDQADYFHLLCTLIEEYERTREPEPEPATPLDVLNHLLEANDLTATAFGELIGVERSTASRILRGERNLTVSHIKVLSERFRLNPEALLG